MKLSLFLACLLSIPTLLSAKNASLDGLFLTWRSDPSSTMTIQWLEKGKLLPVADEAGAARESTLVEPFDIPALDTASSVEASLWKHGFAVDLLTDHSKRFKDFAGSCRLAWTKEGIVVGVDIKQTKFVEAADAKQLWKGDSVEVLLAKEGQMPFHLAIAPGLDEKFNKPRVFMIQGGNEESPSDLTPTIVRTAEGYRLWITIPWKFLSNAPLGEGETIGAQIYLNQRHFPTPKRRLAWHPSWVSRETSEGLYSVRLSSRASSPFQIIGSATRELGKAGATCTLWSIPENDGLPLEVRYRGRPVGCGVLQRVDGESISTANLELSGPGPENRWDEVELYVGGKLQLRIPLLLTTADCFAVPAVDLRYRKKGDATDLQQRTEVKALQSLPGTFLHRVELTGLDADNVYEFGVGEGANALNAYCFRTMPRKLTRPVTIALGGDTRHTKEWMEVTNRMVASHDPDFVVWGGDLADANGLSENSHFWHEWFGAVESSLVAKDGRRIPVVVAVGNHDVKKGYYYQHPGYQPTAEWREKLAPEFYELFAFPGQPGYGVLDFGDYCSLLILDSDHTNPVAGEQTEWLAQTLERRRHVPHLLPIYHIGAYPSVKNFDGRSEQSVRKHWPPLFEQYGVRSAFEHHNHAYKRTHPILDGKVDPSGVVYMGDGAWGVGTRPPMAADKTWYLEKSLNTRHAILLSLDGGDQTLKVLDDQGRLIDECRLKPRK